MATQHAQRLGFVPRAPISHVSVIRTAEGGASADDRDTSAHQPHEHDEEVGGASRHHAAHFLSRLERFSRADTELALSLYNDVPLVEAILRRASLPEGAQRVAIALSHAKYGPHVIVTRGAKFVTCLAPGMSTRPHPVISRADLDAISVHIATLRAKLDACDATLAPGRTAMDLFTRVFVGGPTLSRDEIRSVLPWLFLAAPAIPPTIAKVAHGHLVRADELIRERRMEPSNASALRAHWANMWALGHFLTLATGDAGLLPDLQKRDADAGLVAALVWALTSAALTGPVGVALRAVAFAAHSGDVFIDPLEGILHASNDRRELLFAAAALGAIAHRYPSLAGRVDAVLHEATSRFDGAEAAPLDHGRRRIAASLDLFCKQARAVLADPDAATTRAIRRGASVMMGVISLRRGPRPYATSEDVPRDVALATLAAWHRNPTDAPDILLDAIPFAATAAPEDFYLPADLSGLAHPLGRPTLVLDVIAETRTLRPPRPTAPSAPRIGRNDACPCGSKKKHKRCCGA